MIIDAATTPISLDFAADVVIVGAGAAGITLALDLLKRGMKVVLLEAGGEKPTPATQDAYRTARTTPPSHSNGIMFRRRALGGTTSLWGGRCIPFAPIDFEDRPWIPNSGWPIDRSEIARHYPAAIELCDAAPANFDAATALPKTQAALVDGIDSERVIADQIERFSLPTDFGVSYRNILSRSENLTLILNAPVDRIVTSADGNVATGVSAPIGGSRRLHVQSPVVVLAAGGLEVPRLLLASRQIRDAGLGNEHDCVGRYYQSHIQGEAGDIHFLAPRDAVRHDYERSADGVYCRRYLLLSASAQRKEKLPHMILRPHHPHIADPDHRNAILSAMYFAKSGLLPEYARILTMRKGATPLRDSAGLKHYIKHIRNIALGSPDLAMFLFNWVRYRVLAQRKLPSVVLTNPRNIYRAEFNSEQIPNRESRITLSCERDQHDMPRANIDWAMTDQDISMICRGILNFRSTFEDTATIRLVLSDRQLEESISGWGPVPGHHIGTARMASNPSVGVCDQNGELFFTKNLYIASSAAFPTGGFANPTLTIVALALRLGEYIAQNHHKGSMQ